MFFQRKNNSTEERTRTAMINIGGSLFSKLLSIVTNLLLIPLSIKVLDSDQYGLWLTISSIIMWISYFDIGITHGFRNRYAEANAKGDVIYCKKLISTTYALLSLIFISIGVLGVIGIPLIPWSRLLNIAFDDSLMSCLLRCVIIFFCIKFILNILCALLNADQKYYISSLIETSGNIVILIILFILYRFNVNCSIIEYAYVYCLVPCVLFTAASVVAFNTKYKNVAPSFGCIDFSLSKSIVGIGVKIFIIQITNVLLFQLANIAIMRYNGAATVTQYNVISKYFSIANMLFAIIVTPFWSAFTKAKTEGDVDWLRISYKKLSETWFVLLLAVAIQLCIAPIAISLWVPDIPKVEYGISAIVAVYVVLLSRTTLYCNLLNGLNEVNTQMWTNIILSLICTPLLFWLSSLCGIIGTLCIMILSVLCQCVVCHFQINRILFR